MVYNPDPSKRRGNCKKIQRGGKQFCFWRNGCIMAELILLRQEGLANEKMKIFILQDLKIYFVLERHLKNIPRKIFNIFVISQIYHTSD